MSILSILADRVTTALTLRLRPQFERRGLQFPTHEGNVLLPHFPTLRDQLFHWTNLLVLLFLVVEFTKPIVAVFAVVIEGVQALATLRIWCRLKLALKYFDEAEQHGKVHQPAFV